MREQNLRWLALILLFLMVLSILSIAFAPATLPTMKVEPSCVRDVGIGEFFDVSVNIYDANYTEGTDVYTWQVCMKWDPSVLDIDDVVTWGDFLDAPRVGYWGLLTENAPAGQKVMNITDGSKFVAGITVLIEDDSNNEQNQVVSIMGNQLTMQNDLAHTYTVAAHGGAYPKPDLTPSQNINHAAGRILAGQTTMGTGVPGAQGNGWLCNFTFEVLDDYGETALDIDDPVVGQFTYIINHLGETLGNDAGELTKESGYFSNQILGDIDGDGDVDAGDFYLFSGAYGTSPPSDSRCDLDRDGDVDAGDFYLFSGNYGKTV